MAEFTSLFAAGLTSVERVSTTNARFALTGTEDTAARAQDLARRETECCSFFDFTITSNDPLSAVMDVTVPAAHADVLASLADLAEAAAQRNAAEGVDG
jgi:hypothetical protein